jgi:hypothetical protein
VSEQGLWRLPWAVPVPLILAYAVHEALTRRPGGGALAPAGLTLAVLAAALLAQEGFGRLDGGGFYNRTSSTELLPGTGRSVVLGGVDRAFSGDWRLPRGHERLLQYLDERMPPGSTVVVPPGAGPYVPAALHDARVIGPLVGGTERELRTVQAFYDGAFENIEEVGALRAIGVDYVVVDFDTPADDSLRLVEEVVARSFRLRDGSAVLAERGEQALPYWDWALGPDQTARLGGASFTVPETIDPERRQLEFLLVVAPSGDVERDESARLVISLFQQGLPDGEQQAVNTVADVVLPAGTEAGRLVLRPRSPGTEFSAGVAYGVSVSRLGAAPEDSYPDDVWFVGLKVRYTAPGVEPVPGTDMWLYEVPK